MNKPYIKRFQKFSKRKKVKECRTSIKNGVAIDVDRMEEQQMRRHYIDNLRNFVILLLFPVHTFMI